MNHFHPNTFHSLCIIVPGETTTTEHGQRDAELEITATEYMKEYITFRFLVASHGEEIMLCGGRVMADENKFGEMVKFLEDAESPSDDFVGSKFVGIDPLCENEYDIRPLVLVDLDGEKVQIEQSRSAASFECSRIDLLKALRAANYLA